MKKTLTVLLIAAMLFSMLIPLSASAADGELLIAVNWTSDTFRTVNQGSSACQDFLQKYDLSKSTSDMLFMTMKEGCDDATKSSDMFYIEDTGYYITNDTKYTIYFEVASVHNNKYSGVPFLHENSDYDS